MRVMGRTWAVTGLIGDYIACPPQKKTAIHYLQLRVLRLRLLQNGDVGVGVFPGVHLCSRK